MSRRFRYDPASGEVVETTPPAKEREQVDFISDSMGFTVQQLGEFESDRKAHGFSSIEFKPDPQVPQFYQVHAGSRREMLKYAAHRGLVDKGARSQRPSLGRGFPAGQGTRGAESWAGDVEKDCSRRRPSANG